jgi:hypothetical protein
MIRVDLSGVPKVWHDVPVVLDGAEGTLRVRYAILRDAALAEHQAERLALARLFQAGDQGAAYDGLIARLSPEQRARMRETVAAAIVEWDLADPDGQPIAVTPESLAAVLDYALFLVPLYDGLLEASQGGRAKNA